MRSNTILLVFGMIIILLSGCRKDTFLTESESNPPAPENLFETSISGFVLDESGNPVSDAEVSLVNTMVETNEIGYFNITGLVNEQIALVTVSKPGYFTHYKTLSPTQSQNATNRTRIKLINRVANTSFDAATGGIAAIGDNSRVVFKENSIVDSNGDQFTGPVIVYSHYIDPTDEDIAEYMPGNMMAQNTQEEMTILRSFGMINLELESTAGEPLNINETATIEVEVPSILMANAPTSLPLWYFDEVTGLWQEEGSASLQGNKFVGEVNHFTTWNCDVSEPFTVVHGQVVDGRGVSLVKIRFTDIATGATYSGWIDSEGYFSGFVPQDVELLFEILGFCGDDNVLFSSNIGPFAEDQIDLGVFDITNNNGFTFITGSLVDCDQMPIPNGQVYFNLQIQNYNEQTEVDEDGNFSALIPSCEGEEIIIRGLDLANGLVSDNVIIIPDGQTQDAGMIEVCIDISPTLGSVVMDLPDEVKEFDNCTVSINPFNSLGQTSYLFTYFETLPPVNDTIMYFWLLEDANNDINNPDWVSGQLFWSPPESAEEALHYTYSPSWFPPPIVVIDQDGTGPGDIMNFTFNNISISRRVRDPDAPNVLTSFDNRTMTITAVVQ